MNKFLHQLSHCDHRIIYFPLLLTAIGILTLLSISHSRGSFLSREVIIQSVALLIGTCFACIVLTLGYRYFTELEQLIYPLSILMLLSVYLPGIGTSFNGSRSWLQVGPVTMQPSELVKIAFVILMAAFLSRTRENLTHPKGILMAALYGCPFIIIVAKEDFGSGCVFCAIWLFMVFCGGLDLKLLGKASLSLVILLPLFYFLLASYQKDRIDAFLHPEDLSLPGNYQVWNAKVAIGSGGLFGKGYLHGTQSALGFLPVPESDFIFASFTEEWGFFGAAIVLILFAAFLQRGLKTAKYAADLQGTLIAAGICGMICFQSFENIAMTMGIMPVTGIPLPFLSYGGSSLFSSMLGIGLLLSVSTHQKI